MNLKKIRQENSLRQEDVAKIINKSAVAYGYYESGRSEPDIQTLTKLADFYHTTIDAIVGHTVPYLLDKSTLSTKQKEIVELATELTDEECRYAIAYIQGIKQGIKERNQKFNQGGNK